jgi:hypothetical protein
MLGCSTSAERPASQRNEAGFGVRHHFEDAELYGCLRERRAHYRDSAGNTATPCAVQYHRRSRASLRRHNWPRFDSIVLRYSIESGPSRSRNGEGLGAVQSWPGEGVPTSSDSRAAARRSRSDCHPHAAVTLLPFASRGGTRGGRPHQDLAALFQRQDRSPAFCTDTLIALFDSLMSAKISLFFKINSLFRILGNSKKSIGHYCGF